MHKSLQALLLAAAMLLTVFAVPANAALPVDVVDSQYAASIDLLLSLDVMSVTDDGMFHPDDPLTRGAFTQTVARLNGMDNSTPQTAATPFLDVPPDNELSGAVAFAVAARLVSGYGDGTFRPDEPVTCNQAVKILVCALGYGGLAEQRGGFPAGYLSVAAEQKLLTGLSLDGETVVTRGLAAVMIANALDIDLMQQTGFGESGQYQVIEGQTILSEHLHIEKGEGLVTGNEYARFSDNGMMRYGEVEIAGMPYWAGETDAKDRIGQYVTYYAQLEEEREDKTLLYIQTDPNGDTVTVDAQDILPGEGDADAVAYLAGNGRKKTVSITPDTVVLYNGRLLGSFTMSDLEPQQGSVTFSSSSRNGAYDIVVVRDTVNFVVKNVSTTGDEILVYDKYWAAGSSTDSGYQHPGVLHLNPDDSGSRVVVTADGRTIRPEDMKEWDVATVAQSRDGLVTEIAVSTQRVQGTVEEVVADATPKLVIGGETYEVARNVTEAVALPEVGKSGTFSVDIYGRIAAFNSAAIDQSLTYGYLLNLGKEGTLDTRALFRIVDTEGVWHEVKSAESVQFNGVKTESAALLGSAVLMDENGAVVQQVVSFALNGDGELRELNTEGSPECFIKKAAETGTFKYMSNAKTFGHFLVSDETKFIRLPPSYDADKPEAYGETKLSNFTHNQDYSNLTPYYLSEESEKLMKFDLVIQDGGDGGSGSIDIANQMHVVKRVSTGINEEGETVDRLYTLSGGSEVISESSSGKRINGLHAGDVILLSRSGDVINGYLKVFSADSGLDIYTIRSNINDTGDETPEAVEMIEKF